MYDIELERRRVRTHRIVSLLLFVWCLAVCGAFAYSAWSSWKLEQELHSKLAQANADGNQILAEKVHHQEVIRKLAEARMQIAALEHELAGARKRLEDIHAGATDPVATGSNSKSKSPRQSGRAKTSVATR